MSRTILCIGILGSSLHSTGQITIYEFDLDKDTRDSIVLTNLDTTLTAGKTSFHLGPPDFGVTQLPQTPPTKNIYPETALTYKTRASELFDLTSYPMRTSVKLFKIENDTAKDLCSGSMIGRRHVLTAAHCVSPFDPKKISVEKLKVVSGI